MTVTRAAVLLVVGALLSGVWLPAARANGYDWRNPGDPEVSALRQAMEGGNLERLGTYQDKGLKIDQLLPKPTRSQYVMLPVVSVAMESRNAAAAAYIIDKGADVNRMSVVMVADKGAANLRVGYDLYTPLMHAAATPFAGGASLLLERGADVNAEGAWGVTALMIASWLGSADVVKLLFAAGASVDEQLKDAVGVSSLMDRAGAAGATALWLAARAGSEATVGLLLDAGADVDLEASCAAVPGAKRGDDRCTAVRVAELAGHAKVAALIRSRSPQSFEEDLGWLKRFDEGDEAVWLKMSALVTAQDTRTLSRYLAAGLDVDAYFSKNRRETLLLLAAGSGAERVLAFLLEHGADYEKRTMYADRGNSRGRAIAMNGVDIDAGLLTPLMVSARTGCTKCVSLLVAAGADVDAGSPAGQTALLLAAEEGHVDAMKALLAAGAAVDAAITALIGENAGLRLGATPLWFAARNNHAEAVRLLLEAGADPTEEAVCVTGPITAPVAEKCTPRRITEMEGRQEVLDVFSRLDVSE